MQKHLSIKKRLAHERKRSRAVPAWAMMRTRGKFRVHHRRRHWRRTKLKV